MVHREQGTRMHTPHPSKHSTHVHVPLCTTLAICLMHIHVSVGTLLLLQTIEILVR